MVGLQQRDDEGYDTGSAVVLPSVGMDQWVEEHCGVGVGDVEHGHCDEDDDVDDKERG